MSQVSVGKVPACTAVGEAVSLPTGTLGSEAAIRDGATAPVTRAAREKASLGFMASNGCSGVELRFRMTTGNLRVFWGIGIGVVAVG